MLTSSHFLGAAIMSATMVAGGVALAAEYELVSTVIISRHGVRSPIAGHPALATFAADPWPPWPVPAGHLTPRGAEFAKLLGAYYREYYAAQGLFPANGCPPPGLVFAWADVDQRTLVTAQSLLDGMFPGCNLAPGSLIDTKIDPLLHPTRAGVCKVDPARARRSVTSSAGGSLASLRRTLRTEIAAMQSVLKCCQPALCRAAGANAPCSLRNLPTAIVSEDSGNVRLSGPISIGSTASEIFLLEYAEGFPERQVAWGEGIHASGNSAVVAATWSPVRFDGAYALSCGTTGLGPHGEDIINAATRRGYKRDERSRVHALGGTRYQPRKYWGDA
jgi:4-phytase / acid phosphatase